MATLIAVLSKRDSFFGALCPLLTKSKQFSNKTRFSWFTKPFGFPWFLKGELKSYLHPPETVEHFSVGIPMGLVLVMPRISKQDCYDSESASNWSQWSPVDPLQCFWMGRSHRIDRFFKQSFLPRKETRTDLLLGFRELGQAPKLQEHLRLFSCLKLDP